ncbi:hypothetical protein FQN60_009137, partial [Etheostoma spectabile]
MSGTDDALNRRRSLSVTVQGGTVTHEKRAFSRLILDTAYSFFLPPFSFQIRVGGLYLLYSLYQCQSASPPEQIRLALKNWEDVKKFEKDAVDAQHLDVIYILKQLMRCKAFSFTAMPAVLAFNKKKKMERAAPCEGFMERASRPQELINLELLEADASINLIQKELVPELRSTVVDFYKWQQQKCSKRAQLISSIKSKAYGGAAEASKSRRHRQVEVDFTSHQAGPSLSSGYSKTNKPSLKARTNENIHVSGDLWKEAVRTTHINRLTTLDFVREGTHRKHFYSLTLSALVCTMPTKNPKRTKDSSGDEDEAGVSRHPVQGILSLPEPCSEDAASRAMALVHGHMEWPK